MNPNSGAWTESATSRSRASSPSAAGEVVVHPEAGLEVDLAGVVAAFAQEVEGLLGALPRRKARRPEANASHTLTLPKAR